MFGFERHRHDFAFGGDRLRSKRGWHGSSNIGATMSTDKRGNTNTADKTSHATKKSFSGIVSYSLECHLFCYTSLQLASTRWFNQCIQAFPHYKNCRRLISAASRFRKKFWGTPRIEPGAVGWEARTQPRCYAPSLLFTFQKEQGACMISKLSPTWCRHK